MIKEKNSRELAVFLETFFYESVVTFLFGIFVQQVI